MQSHQPYEEDTTVEVKDYTKYIWIGIAVLIVIMAVLLYTKGPVTPSQSQVRARHILIQCNMSDPVDRSNALNRITNIRQRALEGESFAELAKKYSDDPFSASRGGDLGWSTKGKYDTNFEDYVWDGEIGDISDIIRTQHGFHIIMIEERFLTDVDRHLREQEERSKQLRIQEAERVAESSSNEVVSTPVEENIPEAEEETYDETEPEDGSDDETESDSTE